MDAIWRALRAPNPVLAVAATGAGKTEIFIELARRAGVKTAVVVGRDRLVEQTARRMRSVLPDVGVWSAGQGERRIGPVTVVSIHSADSLVIPDLRLLIVDECHNMNEGRYAAFVARHTGAKLVGFTATPWRGNIRIYGDEQMFTHPVCWIGLRRLIAAGYLVPPVALAMPTSWDTSNITVRGGEFVLGELTKLVDDREKIKAQIADALLRLAGRSKIVWTCVSIEHAESVADELMRLGETVAVIHSKSREIAVDAFATGPYRHAVSVMMLTEGIDVPAVDAIVLMRPTKSATLMVQTVGRGLRPYAGKMNCAVLDYGQVFLNCGPLDDPFVRDAGERRERESVEHVLRICSGCCAYVPAKEPVCPNCGHREQRVVDELANLTRTAAESIPMITTDTHEVSRVRVMQHVGRKSGRPCVKIRFDLKGGIPAFMYISEHPFSFRKGIAEFHKITPFRFDTFDELYQAAEMIGEDVEIPREVVIERNGDFTSVVRICN